MKRTRLNYPKDKIALACEMYMVGMKVKYIASMLRVSRSTTERIINEVFGRKIKEPVTITLKSKVS